jgi:ADP-heptose:LPS heptosyltransferase
MASIVDRLEKGASVAIVRLRSLGDCVLTTPAIALLHAHRPDLRISVVVDPAFRAIFEDNPGIAALIDPAVSALRACKPRLVINLHGGTRSMVLTAASGARFRAGFAHHRYSSIYNVPVPRAQKILRIERKVHTAEHLASAMFYLGVPPDEIPRARLFAAPADSGSAYAVIHAVASAPEKMWPAERFIETAHSIRRHCGMEPVFIGTPADDLSPFREFRTLTPALPETKRLISGASLFLGNDSGPAHIAAAFGVPLVVLFSTSDPVIWAPWKAIAETIVASEGMQALPCTRVWQALERLRVSA